jgi:YHS domain-containing protein
MNHTHHTGGDDHGQRACCAAPNEATLKDPVCGMTVTPQSPHHVSHAGNDYFFCSAGCASKFSADPKKYLDPRPAPRPVSERPDVIYTCPMHPQIRQIGPGNCPICGMSLEPADASVAEDNTELRLMTRRLWIAAALSLPIALMAMTEFAPTLHQRLINVMGPWFGWSQFLLATPVVLWCGAFFFKLGWQSIIHRAPNMFTLIALGVAAAYGFSVFALLFPQTRRCVHDEWRCTAVLRSGGDHCDLGDPRTGARATRDRKRRRQCALLQLAPLQRCVSKPTVRSAKSRLIRCMSVIGCAYGRARKCRSTAPCSKAARTSTNR